MFWLNSVLLFQYSNTKIIQRMVMFIFGMKNWLWKLKLSEEANICCAAAYPAHPLPLALIPWTPRLKTYSVRLIWSAYWPAWQKLFVQFSAPAAKRVHQSPMKERVLLARTTFSPYLLWQKIQSNHKKCGRTDFLNIILRCLLKGIIRISKTNLDEFLETANIVLRQFWIKLQYLHWSLCTEACYFNLQGFCW